MVTEALEEKMGRETWRVWLVGSGVKLDLEVSPYVLRNNRINIVDNNYLSISTQMVKRIFHVSNAKK